MFYKILPNPNNSCIFARWKQVRNLIEDLLPLHCEDRTEKIWQSELFVVPLQTEQNQ